MRTSRSSVSLMLRSLMPNLRLLLLQGNIKVIVTGGQFSLLPSFDIVFNVSDEILVIFQRTEIIMSLPRAVERERCSSHHVDTDHRTISICFLQRIILVCVDQCGSRKSLWILQKNGGMSCSIVTSCPNYKV